MDSANCPPELWLGYLFQISSMKKNAYFRFSQNLGKNTHYSSGVSYRYLGIFQIFASSPMSMKKNYQKQANSLGIWLNGNQKSTLEKHVLE